MAFFGKVFKFEKAENHEEFVNSLGLPGDSVGLFMNFKPNQKIEQADDTYIFTFDTPRGDKSVPFTSGVEFEDTIREFSVTNKFTVAGNTLTHVMKFDIGLTITSHKEFDGNTLVEKLSNNKWNGEATIYYTA